MATGVGLKVDGLWASSKLQKQKVWTSSLILLLDSTLVMSGIKQLVCSVWLACVYTILLMNRGDETDVRIATRVTLSRVLHVDPDD